MSKSIQILIKEYEDAVNAKTSSTETPEAKIKVLNEQIPVLFKAFKHPELEFIDGRGSQSSAKYKFKNLKGNNTNFSIDMHWRGMGADATVESLFTFEMNVDSFGPLSSRLNDYRGTYDQIMKDVKEKGFTTIKEAFAHSIKAFEIYNDVIEKFVTSTQAKEILDIDKQIKELYKDETLAKIEAAHREAITLSLKALIDALQENVVNELKKGWTIPHRTLAEIDSNIQTYASIIRKINATYYDFSEIAGYNPKKTPAIALLPLFWESKDLRSMQAEKLKLAKINTKSVTLSIDEPQKPSALDAMYAKDAQSRYNFITAYSGKYNDFATASHKQTGVKVATTLARLIALAILFEPQKFIPELSKNPAAIKLLS